MGFSRVVFARWLVIDPLELFDKYQILGQLLTTPPR